MKILYKYVNKYNGICINKNGKYEPFEGSQHVLLRALGVFTSSHPHHKRVKEPPPPLFQSGRQRLRHVGSFAQGHTDTQVAELGFDTGMPGSSARALASPSLPLRLGCDLLVGDKSVWSVFSGVSKKRNRVE